MQTKLHSLSVKFLKNISELKISFDGKDITGIFGANGCGKSTIIHALPLFRHSRQTNSKNHSINLPDIVICQAY
ncbi:AAA family ATPase [Synechocystis sp. PCC 7338]|nr:AAA family ATPase [Synechocystis sp. PCC 7338]